ncbi:Flp family type IVb pilin (plasmid) [Comamonadaceae bacterium OTU4NAUVB1]|nr:Flp family type IVb pilin [Comamonadaceae bacterium OTU4NAUVB1]
MKAAFLKFIRDERGATAIEYGIIAGLIAVVLIAAFGPAANSISSRLTTAFANIATHLATIL